MLRDIDFQNKKARRALTEAKNKFLNFHAAAWRKSSRRALVEQLNRPVPVFAGVGFQSGEKNRQNHFPTLCNERHNIFGVPQKEGTLRNLCEARALIEGRSKERNSFRLCEERIMDVC